MHGTHVLRAVLTNRTPYWHTLLTGFEHEWATERCSASMDRSWWISCTCPSLRMASRFGTAQAWMREVKGVEM